jgi:hypothetical protein
LPGEDLKEEIPGGPAGEKTFSFKILPCFKRAVEIEGKENKIFFIIYLFIYLFMNLKTQKKSIKRKKLKSKLLSTITYDKKIAKGFCKIDYYKAHDKNVRMYEFIEKAKLRLSTPKTVLITNIIQKWKELGETYESTSGKIL